MWILDRLKEKSTWVGIVGYGISILSHYNIIVPVELQPILEDFGLLLTSAVLIIMKEKKS
jgi:hypothetical protein